MKEKKGAVQPKERCRPPGGVQKRNNNKDRYKQFRGNKKEGQGFADKRKTKMLHEYHKMMKKQQGKIQEQAANTREMYLREQYQEEMASSSTSPKKQGRPKKRRGMSSLHGAQVEWQKKQEEAKQKIQAKELAQEHRQKALQQYQEQKKAKHKKLCVKNYKGQPNMTSQMELLLDKIQAQQGTS